MRNGRQRLRSGKLRHLIEIERPFTTHDPEGYARKEWQLLAKTWASIEPIKGEEYFAAAAVQAATTHRVTMRVLPSITVKPWDRLVFKGRILEIEAVMDTEERGRELELLCKEKH